MGEPVIITIIPTERGKFIAKLGDRQLCQPTFMPFFAAARVLLAEGYDPTIKIILRHQGSDTDCLTAPIGAAAKLAISENKSGPIFGPFRPFDRAAFARGSIKDALAEDESHG